MESRDGVINLFKPTGITSAKALYRVRRATGVRKSGHAGTLDPAADGVLVICLGQATKLVERVMDQFKIYRATARLDLTSDSFDSEGSTRRVDVDRIPSSDDVSAALASFEGRIMQTPPAISAVKIGGVPAYKLARRGESPALRAREAMIYWIRLTGFDWPQISFEMACGRGTYVRSLIRDLGLRLESGGCLTSLRRMAVGPFTIDQSQTFEQLETAPPPECIIPLADARVRLEAGAGRIPSRPANS